MVTFNRLPERPKPISAGLLGHFLRNFNFKEKKKHEVIYKQNADIQPRMVHECDTVVA
jgi:hypothetical protein